ncbi:MAG: ribose-5-phosphate isomerase RpiA [Ktedonobacterales bacterium]
MSQHDEAASADGTTSSDTPEDAADRAARWKAAAAQAAVASIPEGAVVGLGTGSTADLMLRALAARVRQGLSVTGVASSDATRDAATALGIRLAALDDVQALTCSIDGADEVTLPQLNLIKGRGGALLREKLVATASRFRIVIVDVTKLVPVLASGHPVPVEVVPFGWRHTAGRLVALGARPVLRPAGAAGAGDAVAAPFVTDCGNYILDCAFAPLYQPEPLAAALKAVVGVVEHGIFIGMTDRVYAGGPDGVQVFGRP